MMSKNLTGNLCKVLVFSFIFVASSGDKVATTVYAPFRGVLNFVLFFMAATTDKFVNTIGFKIYASEMIQFIFIR